MAIALGARLVQTCEGLCDELRRAIGLTIFRIELDRRPTPLVVTLRPGVGVSELDWRPPIPASLETILVHDRRRVGVLRIQDERRASYPDGSADHLHRIVARYAGTLAEVLDEGQF
jgi:hypothetical protein